ncbi:hypothetical protein KDI_38060 [Dictyobacter arantiisoli]|uniref:Uncharacterized protein n=1 Tax=Dictyobacter arantiisoli TaxID=2014874 RepID=A0A5A5TFP6_9CHLR|nr:hypothetical protein KDI_38060 [Dictyobacter arantiisoli]
MINMSGEEILESMEPRADGSIHSTTESVIELLKKDSRITDQQIADELHLKNAEVARGWRIVAEETIKARNWKATDDQS